MAFALKKSQPFAIKKADGTAVKVARLELFWDSTGARPAADLDGVAVEVGADGKVVDMQVCFYFNQKTNAMAYLKGDSRNGVSEDGKPDEVMQFDLGAMNASTTKVPVIVTIDEAVGRGHSFTSVANARVDLYDNDTNTLIATGNLTDLTGISALFGEFTRTADGFTFTLASEGSNLD